MNIRPNRIKQKLAAGEIAYILSGAANADMIDQLGPIGVDGFWLEGEHGPVDFGDISDLTRACDLWGATSVLRLSHNEYGDIYRALDRGASSAGVWLGLLGLYRPEGIVCAVVLGFAASVRARVIAAAIVMNDSK